MEEITGFMDDMMDNMVDAWEGRYLADYNDGEFVDPSKPFNQDPPSPMATFIIGGVLMLFSFGMWLQRLQILKKRKDGDLHGTDLLRGMIACAIDNDSPYYSITSFSAVSFLFLGGIQINFQWTFVAMIIYYAIVSCGDSLRVLLAYWSHDSLQEIFLTSSLDKGLESKQKEAEDEKDKKFETMEIQPTNIYEDMGREKTIVWMIFFTQVTFITFVCLDVYRADTVNCLDGTKNCPVGGTLGSYGFYIMGIFQACLYILGPKTSFGQSEQNPGFWLVLLLSSKRRGVRLLWENPVRDARFSKNKGTLMNADGELITDDAGDPKWFHLMSLNRRDYRIWLRFFMSYIVNGVGFHILIHTLPIQVASQTSFTGVVFRAVGMLYLVDLDDTAGFRLIIDEKDEGEDQVEEGEPESGKGGAPPEAPIAPATNTGDDEQPGNMEETPPGDEEAQAVGPDDEPAPEPEPEPEQEPAAAQEDRTMPKKADTAAINAEAEKILEEARAKLDHLWKNGPTSKVVRKSTKKSVTGFKTAALNNFGCQMPTTGTLETGSQNLSMRGSLKGMINMSFKGDIGEDDEDAIAQPTTGPKMNVGSKQTTTNPADMGGGVGAGGGM